MTESDMRSLIRAAKAEVGTWQRLAARFEVSESYLHGVASGAKPVSDEIARQLGYRRIKRVEFEPLETEGSL